MIEKNNQPDLSDDPKKYLHLLINNATNYNTRTPNNNINSCSNKILKTKTNNKSITKIPQIINNYDVKVNITKEKSNNINIKSMNVSSLFSNNIKVKEKKVSNKKIKKYVFRDINLDNYLDDSLTQNKIHKSKSKKKYLSAIDSPKDNKSKTKINLDNLDKMFSNTNENFKYDKIINNLKDEFKKIGNKNEIRNSSDGLFNEDNLLKNIIHLENNINKKKIDKNIDHQNNLFNNYNQDANDLNLKSKKIFKRKPKNFTSIDVNNIGIFKLSSINKIKKINNRAEKIKHHETNVNSVNARKNTYTNNNDNITPKNKSETRFKYFTNYNTNNNSSFSSDNNENNENYKIKKNPKYSKLKKFCISNTISLNYIVDKNSKNYFIKLYFNVMKTIVNVQNKILIDCKNEIDKLKNELSIKSNELKKYYEACFSLIKFFYSKNYFVSEINKMKINLESQILKENEILKNIVNTYKNNVTDNKNIFRDMKCLWDDEMDNAAITQKNLMKMLLYHSNDKTSKKNKITATNSPSNSKLVLQDKDIISGVDNNYHDLLSGDNNKNMNFTSLFKNYSQKPDFRKKIRYAKIKKNK